MGEKYELGFVICALLTIIFFTLTITMVVSNGYLQKELMGKDSELNIMREINEDRVGDLEKEIEELKEDKFLLENQIITKNTLLEEKQEIIEGLEEEIEDLEKEEYSHEEDIHFTVKGFEREEDIPYYLSTKFYKDNIGISVYKGGYKSAEITIPIITVYQTGDLRIKTGTITLISYKQGFGWG